MPRRTSPLLLTLPFLLAATARAQQAPPVPAATPTFFCRLSITSLDAASKFVADLGFPLPPLKPRLESTFPFLGPDSVAANRPLGVLFLASDQIKELQNAVLFAIPLADGNATAKALTAAGATPDPALPNRFTMSTLNLLCTPTYLVFETGESAGLPLFTDASLARDVDPPGTIAALSLDLAAARKAAPNGYRTAFDTIKHNAQALNAPANPAQAASERYGQELAYSILDKLQTFTLALATDDAALHLKLHISPAPPAPPAPLPRPAFPADVLLNAHIVYPNADWAAWATRLVDAMPKEVVAAKATAAQAARQKAVVKRAVDLFLGGNAVSFAVAIHDGSPVVYLVNQRPDPVDAGTVARALIADMAAIDKEIGKSREVTSASSYDAGGGNTATRITIKNDDTLLYVDILQTGKTVFATFTPADGHFVPALATLPANGTTAALCSGSADLAALLNTFGEKNPALAALPPALQQELKTALAGQSVTWTAQPDAKTGALLTDFQLPLPLARQLAKLVFAVVAERPATP